MNKLATILASSVLLAPSIGGAQAADLLVKTPSALPSVASSCAAARFAGFYAGASAGAIQQSSTWNDLDYWWYGGSKSFKDHGGTVGVQAGYNHVFCNTLLGVEADANWSGAEQSSTFSYYSKLSRSLDWYGTVRARGGFVLDSTLLYLTAGLAWGRTEYSWTYNDNYWYRKQGTFDDLGTTGIGWVVGAGIEHALTDRISVKAEALYLDLGGKSDKNGFDYRVKVDTSAAIGRLGLNVRF